jgi:hypothetical protein
VVERTVRGLYFHEFHAPLPEDHDVMVLSDEALADLPAEQLMEYHHAVIGPLARLPARTIGNRVFSYRFTTPEQQKQVFSVWALTFFAGISFLAITGPKNLRSAQKDA